MTSFQFQGQSGCGILEENMKALTVELTPSDLRETDARLQQTSVEGERYTPEMMALVHG
jgi:hypothetical protein